MRLRVVLTGAVLLALGVVGLRLLSLAGDAREAASLDRQRAAVEIIARDATGLLVLTQDYLLHASPRALRQWAAVQRELSEALRDYAAVGPVQQAEVAGIVEVAANLPPLFESLAQLRDLPGSGATIARRETVADQLLNEMRRISDGAFEVSHKVTERRREANRNQRNQALATQAAMLTLTLLLAWLLLRRVLSPLARLQRGAQAVQDGDLTARIGYRSRDEIGQLASAFDAMTASLQERAEALNASHVRLARSEAFQERAGRVAGVGGWELELDSGRLSWSEQTRAIHEVPPDYEPTVPLGLAFYAPEGQTALQAAIAATVADGTPWDLELPMTTARGRALWVRATGAAEFRDGRAVRLVGALQDITGRRAADEALRDATRAAQAANEAKTVFLANMSHEIRTPMNAVIGLSYLMQQTHLDDDQQALLGKINAAGRALLDVINDVLDLTKIEAGEMEFERTPFDLHALVDELAGLYAPQAAQRGIVLHTGLPEALPPRLLGDEARVRQILTNLLSNALKFTLHGEVRLQVGVDDAAASPLRLRFTVQDSGIGMDAELLARLFTPFTQADASTTRRFGGTGLGLSIVKRLVTLLGGDIAVHSEVGRGSRFELSLPFEPAPGAGTDAPSQTPLDVLLAEDDSAQRRALLAACQSLGWRTEAVASGEALVERVRRRRREGTLPDVLLVDWRLPGLDGLQALAQLRQDGVLEVSPAVVMVSAAGREALAREPLAPLADELLDKPVALSTLFNSVRAAVARRSGDATRVVLASALEVAGLARLPGVRVLVADDSDINREVAHRILTQEGAEVRLAGDGAAALDALRAHGHETDAVLMDVQMPVLDGLAATRQIRGELGLTRLPVIALTAGALLSERQRALEAGMDSFVSKPFEPHSLVMLLRRQVEHARGTPLPLAPRPEAPAASSWPAIDGIHRAEVQRRLDGDLKLFTRLLERLCQDFGDLALVVPLPDGPAAKAELTARLHKLAGSAGLLGAARVRQAASEAEQALRRGTTPDLGAVEGALQDLLHASAAWRARARQRQGVAQPPIAHGSGQPPDAQTLEVWKAQLSANDLGALTNFDRLAPALRMTCAPERFAAIDAAMSLLAFDQVLALIPNTEPD